MQAITLTGSRTKAFAEAFMTSKNEYNLPSHPSEFGGLELGKFIIGNGRHRKLSSSPWEGEGQPILVFPPREDIYILHTPLSPQAMRSSHTHSHLQKCRRKC